MARAQAEGWNLVALDLGIDLHTPAGEFMANVMASAAQWERRIIGQRTRDALATKRAQGVRLGRPRQLSGSIVDRIVAERDSGWSLRAIADGLNVKGVPTAHGGARWHASTTPRDSISIAAVFRDAEAMIAARSAEATTLFPEAMASVDSRDSPLSGLSPETSWSHSSRRAQP